MQAYNQTLSHEKPSVTSYVATHTSSYKSSMLPRFNRAILASSDSVYPCNKPWSRTKCCNRTRGDRIHDYFAVSNFAISVLQESDHSDQSGQRLCRFVATMAETSSEEEAQELRVKNMQALLKWSAAQDTTGDGASACASNAHALTHSSCLCTLQEHHPTMYNHSRGVVHLIMDCIASFTHARHSLA
jgi:hypothetical protein